MGTLAFDSTIPQPGDAPPDLLAFTPTSGCIEKNHIFVSCFAKRREHHDGGIHRALDGSGKTVRKKHAVELSRGDGKITKKQAEMERDKFLAEQNAPTVEATVERVAATALISEIKSPACRKRAT